MKQVLRKGLKEIVVEDVPDPTPIPHHVVVQPAFSLISSGTESASIHRKSMLKLVSEKPEQVRMVLESLTDAGPVSTLREVRAKFHEFAVMGYSGAGVVVATHPTVADMPVGTRVAYGGEGTGHCEYVLAGRNLVAPVPEQVHLKDACFTTLGSIALNATRIAEIGLGDTVAVVGLGLVGQLVSQVVRCQGGRVFAVDLRAERLQLATELGAEKAIVADESTVDSVRALTAGRGVDCVIIAAASKSNAPALQALKLVRDRGRIVVVGAVDTSFPWEEMYLKEVKLLMSRAYGPGSYDAEYESKGRDYPYAYVRWTENRNMEEFLRLVAAKRVDPRALITHEFELEQAAAAYDTMLSPASRSLAVVLEYPKPAPALEQAYSPKTKVETTRAEKRTKKANRVSVGLVGAGHLARWAHLPLLQKHPRTHLRAVCSSSGARGKNYATRFGADYCTTDYDEMLSDPAIDAIAVVTRNAQHASQTVAALEAGKHVFVEKPLALTEDECRAIYRASQASGRHVMVGFNRRFAPLYRAVKQKVARRQGPVVLNCRVNSPGISGTYWMADPRAGGAILGEACHFVDLFAWLLESEPDVVSAFHLPTKEGEPVGENNLVAAFRFEDGSVANLTYCTTGSDAGGGERLEVYGAGFNVVTEDFKRLWVDGRKRRGEWYAKKGYDAQIRDFIESVVTGNRPGVTLEDGVRSTMTCLAMLDSAGSGEPRRIRWAEILAAR